MIGALFFGVAVVGATWLVKLVRTAPDYAPGRRLIRRSWIAGATITAVIIAVAFIDETGDGSIVGEVLLAPLVGLILAGPFVLLGAAWCWLGEAEEQRNAEIARGERRG